MVRLKRQIVSRSVENARSYGRGNPVNYVVIHQTGNTNRGANAAMHARLQSNLNPRQASWHETVDDKEAIQSFEDSVRCWAATDGRKANGGNMTGYHIEICINSDGDYVKAVENGAKRAAAKLKQHGLGIGAMKQHNDFHPKNCPAQIRAGKYGITWSKFVEMVRGYMSGTAEETSPSAPETGVKWVGTNDKGKELIVDTASLNYYDTQRWSNPTGSKKRGFKWKIDNLYRVNGSLQYRVQDANGRLFYTSGRSDLVKIGGEYGATRKTAPRRGGTLPNATYYVKNPPSSRFNGSGVRAVQEALASVYFYPKKGSKNNGIDGWYGPDTADAVKRFQSVHGLKADGVYGPATRRKLESVRKNK